MPGSPATSPRVGAPRFANTDAVDFAGQVNGVTDAFDLAVAVNIVGELKMYAGLTVPTGWLVCDGAAVSRTTYAALFTVIAATFGAGDGATTFNLPDLRDRVPVGASATIARGATGGSKTHPLTTAEMPSHKHNARFTGYNNQTFSGTGSGPYVKGSDGGAGTGLEAWAVGDDLVGGGGAHNNMQPYVGIYYLIKT